MSVIIRLQNLPWSANALDIRQFFHGLSIPEGGVHIVGGEQGDAFIAFSTDEDARQAFGRNNGKLKEVQVTLMLSSRTEMQKVIEAARAQSFSAFMQAPAPVPTPVPAPLPAIVPPIVPAPVPEIAPPKKSSKDSKRDRVKRSRSRSRDRKDKDKDKGRDRRRQRDRSRTRSRERRDRRKRGRSRSRDRKNRRSAESGRDSRKIPEVWANAVEPALTVPPAPSLLNFTQPAIGLENARRNLNTFGNVTFPQNGNGGNNLLDLESQSLRGGLGEGRTSWPPADFGRDNQRENRFLNAPENNLLNASQRLQVIIPAPQPQQNSYPNNNNNNSGVPVNNVNSRRFQRPQMNNSPQPTNFSNQRLDDGFKTSSPLESNCCVKMQPFYGTFSDIRRFFQGSLIVNSGIKCINDDHGNKTGLLYIRFAHARAKAEALNKNGEVLNGVKVTVQHLNDQEYDLAIDQYSPDHNDKSKKRSGGPSTNQFHGKPQNVQKFFNNTPEPEPAWVYSCLTVDDLPSYVKEQDILKLFGLRSLLALYLVPKPRGGPTAYVKFASPEEAKLALNDTANHQIGNRPIIVKPCEDQDFEAVTQEQEMVMDGNMPEPEPIILDTNCLNLTGLPLATDNIEVTNLFSDIGIRPVKIHLMSNRMGFTGQAFCEFKSNEDASEAIHKDGTICGLNEITIQPITREEMNSILQQTQQQPLLPNMPNQMMRPNMINPMQRPFFPRGQGFEGFDGPPNRGHFNNMGPRGPPRQHRFNNPGPNDEPLPGCTVYLDNVPYKAGSHDILEFFAGYDVSPNVSRRFNNNKPSPEARVLFNSPDEAFRAVQERHGQKIWDRPIFLKQV